MPVKIETIGECCTDCALIIVNDDDSGINDPATHRAAMARGYERLGCIAYYVGDDVGFSYRSCDVCDSGLGGDRFELLGELA